MSIPETSRVFLDTSIFVQYKFDYNNLEFRAFADLCDSEAITYVTMEIATIEQLKKIADEVTFAAAAHSTFRKKAGILRSLGNPIIQSLVEKISANDLIQKFSTKHQKFIQDVAGELISSDEELPIRAMQAYVTSRPPFGSGEKKCEFPDALMLLTLEHWHRERNQKCYVVSTDEDHRRYCEANTSLLHCSNLRQLISLFYSNDASLLQVYEVIERNYSLIEKEIREVVPDLPAFVLDEVGSVNSVEAIEVAVLSHDIVRRNGKQVYVAIDAELKLEAEVSYEDTSHAMWGKEEQRYWFAETVEVKIASVESLPFSLECEIDLDAKKFLSVTSVGLTAGKSIDFEIHANEM